MFSKMALYTSSLYTLSTSPKNICYITHCHVMHLKFELILIYNKAAMDNIFSNISHLEWKVGLSYTLLKGDHPGQIWLDIWH